MDEQNDSYNDRKGTRLSLSVGLNNLIHSLDNGDEESKKIYRAAKVQNMFKQAIQHVYKDSAFLILQSINAVYFLKERDKGMLKEARPGAKLVNRLAIYTCDSMVYADLDSRQEIIKHWFNNHNERVDKLELYSSKFNMRKRFPYKADCELLKSEIVSEKNANKTIDAELSKELISKIEDIENEKLRAAMLSCISTLGTVP